MIVCPSELLPSARLRFGLTKKSTGCNLTLVFTNE